MVDSGKLKNRKEARVRGRSSDLNGIKRVIDFNSYEQGDGCKETKPAKQLGGGFGDKQPSSRLNMLR